jgi:hypothetical protein
LNKKVDLATGASSGIGIAITVETIVDLSRERAFLGIVPIELRSVFTGFGPLPAVTGVNDQVGGWDAAGQTRTVIFADGSSARERLTEYKSPQYFSYTVSGFTNVLRFLTTSIHGEWWFEPVSEVKTSVKWRYAFNPPNLIAVPLVWFIANVLMRGYMKKSLFLTKRLVESNPHPIA